MINLVSYGQVHDFDSLYNNNEFFQQYIDSSPDAQDLFLIDDVMNVTIESDFKNLVKKKGKDEYQPAVFKYFMNDTVTLVRNITIRPRGLSRKRYCFFPPIKLNFPKEKAITKQMEEFSKLKMVSDCQRGDAYEQYLLSEYMVYKMLNIITDYSLKVRLIRVTYIDTGEKYKPDTKYAFIIENKNQMAKRLDAMAIDLKSIKDEYMEESTLINTYIFEYLIGNTDWSVPASHNFYFLKSTDPVQTKPFLVPYDFDLAGIVNANYAKPNLEVDIESVRDRYYMGICLPEEKIKEGLKVYLEKKNEIYALYQNTELFDKENKRSTIIYLNEFYNIIENEDKLASNIINSCKK
jgi:hypothetical protein